MRAGSPAGRRAGRRALGCCYRSLGISPRSQSSARAIHSGQLTALVVRMCFFPTAVVIGARQGPCAFLLARAGTVCTDPLEARAPPTPRRFGFNCGSTYIYMADGGPAAAAAVSRVALNMTLCASSAGMTALVLASVHSGGPGRGGAARGAQGTGRGAQAMVRGAGRGGPGRGWSAPGRAGRQAGRQTGSGACWDGCGGARDGTGP